MPMSIPRAALATWLALASPALAHSPEPKMTDLADVSRLAFLQGTWRNAWFEATYTSPEGGMVLSVNKEFREGKVAFFEVERFDVRDGRVTMQPFLNGKQAPVSFPLVELVGDRAHFRNAAHDFPQDLVYERVAPDRLLIVLNGVEDGKARELRFDLRHNP
jgi:hypothetical protein